MREFVLPIEERAENLERAVEIVQAEAKYEAASAMFMGVPLVAVPGQSEEYTRGCWRMLFDRLQANPPAPEVAKPEPSQPASRTRKFFWFMFNHTPLGYIAIALLIFAAVCGYRGYSKAHPDVVSYDSRDGSITINVDAWRAQLACPDDYVLNTMSQNVGSDHGNVSEKLTPFCQSKHSWLPDTQN